MARGKHFINDTDDLVVRLLRSLLVNNESLRLIPEKKVLYRQHQHGERKVILVSGGGSGHEPAHAGFVGEGMLDVAVAGNIFASPSAPQIFAGMQALDSPLGTLLITKNYTGDKLNFGLAAEQAKAQGRDVRIVFVEDDVSIKGNELVGRRGLAGTVFVHKIAGAAAAQGLSLDEVTRVAQKTADSLATVAVSLDRCSVPQREEQDYLDPDTVEYGMGIHNEPGAERAKITSLQDTVAKLLSIILSDRNDFTDPIEGGVAVMINNLGGLSVLELHVVADEVLRQLGRAVPQIRRVFIGAFVTALDGPGVSVTLLKLDSELEALLDAPTTVNAWPKSVSGYSAEGQEQQIVSAQVVNTSQGEATLRLPLPRELLQNVISGVVQRVQEDEPLITKYDTIAGDGDCGTTLLAGANALSGYVKNISSESVDLAVTFRQIASLIQDTMGGTSGAIYAIFFNAVSTALDKSAGPANGLPYSKVFANVLQQGLNELCRYTSAREGSRTIMDALIPFVHNLHENPGEFQAAIAAARTGAEKTRRMDAKLGRASYVTKEQLNSIKDGVPDPGALGVVSILEGIETGLLFDTVIHNFETAPLDVDEGKSSSFRISTDRGRTGEPLEDVQPQASSNLTIADMSDSSLGDGRGDADLDGDKIRTSSKKRARTRTGCWTCNERRPVCSNCLQKGETCEWGIRLSFRDENVQTISQNHPSMRQETHSRRSGGIEVVDVTNEVIRDYWTELQATEHSEHSLGNNVPASTTALNSDHRDSVTNGGRIALDSSFASKIHGASMENAKHQQLPLPSPPLIRTRLRGSNDMLSPEAARPSIGSGYGEPSHESPASVNTSHSYDMARSAAAQLLDLGSGTMALTPMLNSLPIQAHLSSQILSSPPQTMQDIPESAGISPEQLFADDGIFLPGSAYLELHSVLRNHIFETARSANPSRRASPKPLYDIYMPDASTQEATEAELGEADQAATQLSDATPRSADLTKQEEHELWKNWVDEIAPWLDKFDNECHFQRRLPALAKEHSHLRFAMLALSARQLERKFPERSSSVSLALYQEAIHQLIPHLQTKSTEIVASCVVLCVLEMMNCSPQMWRRHLDGCACLIQSLGMNGFSGGVEQALFWCFARMDVCGGLISSESTLIPPASWTPEMSLGDAIELFRRNPGLDMYASFSVFLCAEVLDLFASDDSDAEFSRRWNELFAHIEEWYNQRPSEMRSILSQPASTSPGDTASPFPTLLFSNPPAISGNQLYHTAALLMLQKKPRRAILPSKVHPVLWHARRICAISICNKHHGCWTNCIQPLWIAGQVMSHHAEHQAILEAYELIEKETGWGATWRAEDLKSHWGQLDEN
ncbi:Dihydroxyacetone kinase 2 [Paramyrothecium foliicola]|nr:Dihydroxyacetone kinase 2 [Paramyrothecium foliicola]